MEHSAPPENKAGSDAVTTPSDMKRNIPLLSCIALIPLTHKLNRADCGYQVHGAERNINHLLHMDGLKLLSCSEEELENEINIVKAICKDINMNFGFKKCAKICLKKVRVQRKTYTKSTFEKDTKELDSRKTYKYLGIEDSHDIQHKNEKEKLTKEYLRRLTLVLDTELNAKNKIQATGALALQVLRHSFGIINWHHKELQKLDRKTRKLLTIHGQHHPKADVDCLYVSRKYGGRGLMQLEEAYKMEITKRMEYVDSTKDPLTQIVRTHQNNTKSALVCPARTLRTELQKGTR
jgi:hypothetical protein